MLKTIPLAGRCLREQFLASEEYRRLHGKLVEEPSAVDAALKGAEDIQVEPYEKVFLEKLLHDTRLADCKNILEIGCGRGNLVRALVRCYPNANVTGIDPFLRERWKTGEAAGSNWQVRTGDGQNIEYPENSFDLIVSVAAFEHIPSPEKCLEEVRRVLKPGGFFATTFSPIWSGIIGHHCKHWVEETVKLIPPWGHLYMSYNEMLRYLENSASVTRDKAKRMCDTIYMDQVINRVDVKWFEQAFSTCGMKLLEKEQIILGNQLGWLTGETANELTPDILQKLNGRYTMEELLVCGYMLTMQK